MALCNISLEPRVMTSVVEPRSSGLVLDSRHGILLRIGPIYSEGYRIEGYAVVNSLGRTFNPHTRTDSNSAAPAHRAPARPSAVLCPFSAVASALRRTPCPCAHLRQLAPIHKPASRREPLASSHHRRLLCA